MSDALRAALRQRAIRSCVSQVKAYRPWVVDGRSPQRRFHAAAATHRKRVYRAGNRSGKTTAGGWEAVAWCQGQHDEAPFRPPVHGWVSALDWHWGIGSIVWPTMKPFVDWSLVRSVKWYRKAEPEIPEVMIWRNGSSIEFKSADAGRKKYQGAKLHFLWLDEEHPGDVAEEGRARLVDLGGSLWLTLTPVARARWVMELERERGTLVVRASMTDAMRAGLLDEAAVADFLDALPDRQRQVRDLGDFAALEGLVYPTFDREVHVARPRRGQLYSASGRALSPWPLPESWPRFASIDFGYGVPTAVIVACEIPELGVLVVERVYYQAFTRITTWGRILKEVLPPLRAPMVADHDRMEREELRAVGINTRPAKKDVEPGLECVERMLHVRKDGLPSLLMVVEDEKPPRQPMTGRCDAHWLIWEIEGYSYPEKKNAEARDPARDLPLKRDDHACDALRYLGMLWERRRGGPPKPPKTRRRLREGIPAGFSPATPKGW